MSSYSAVMQASMQAATSHHILQDPPFAHVCHVKASHTLLANAAAPCASLQGTGLAPVSDMLVK